MMSDGYVWIATASFGSAVDSYGPDKIDDIHGVVFFFNVMAGTLSFN